MPQRLFLSLLSIVLVTAATKKHSIINDATIVPPPGGGRIYYPDRNDYYATLSSSSSPSSSSSISSPCDSFPGVWTGFVGSNPLYDEYDLAFQTGAPLGQWTAVVLRPAPAGEGWTYGSGQFSGDNTTTVLTLDNGLTLHGNVSNDCSIIYWDNGSSWRKTSGIDKVHLVMMNHLDVGYNGIPGIGYINNILNIYFSIYFPRAIAIARALRDLGGIERYIYTTHPWLVDLYIHCPPNFTLSGVTLQCPDSSAVQEFIDAVQIGDIVFHAAPFNTEWENAFSTDAINFHFQLAKDLANELNVPVPQTVSLRDVPGTTRALVPLMVANNLTAISIGVNDAAPNADMPNPGVWYDPDTNTSVLYMQTGPNICYPWPPGPDPMNPGGLSQDSCVVVPGAKEALCWFFRIDNSGPAVSVEEVLDVFTISRWVFPGAQVYASTFDNFTSYLTTIQDTLPVTTKESGDNWIQSTTGDPWKMIYYREASRAYSECLITNQCDTKDPRIHNFMRLLIKIPEHTYGLPSYADTTNWTNEQFHNAIAMNNSVYVQTLNSYLEQNTIVTELGMEYLADHPLRYNITQRMNALQPVVPATDTYVPVPSNEWTNPITVTTAKGPVSIGLDGSTGSLSTLIMNNVSWTDKDHVIGQFIYKTFDDNDYATQQGFCCWGVGGRQQGANPNSTVTSPTITNVWTDSRTNPTLFIVQLSMPVLQVTNYGAPQTVYYQYTVTADGNVNFDVQFFNKTATRIGEAGFLSFSNILYPQYTWYMKKLNSWIDPLDVVNGSSPHSHGISDGIAYRSDTNTSIFFAIDSLDAHVMSPATDSTPATNFIVPATALEGTVTGFSSLLFQNAFNTNTPQFTWQSNFHWRYVIRTN